MNSQIQIPDQRSPAGITSYEEAIYRLQEVIGAPNAASRYALLVYLSILATFLRAQDTLPILGVLKIPTFLTVLPLFFWLPRYKEDWTSQTKAMAALLIFGGLTGPFAVNTSWSFHSWRDLLMQFTFTFFPLVVFLSYGKTLRRLVDILALCGLYLGLYAATHAGRGPGGFLGDENDLGCVLVSFLAFPIFMLPQRKGLLGKLFYAASAAMLFVGIISTGSRGTFLGVLVLGLFYFFKSPSKMLMVVILSIFVLGSAIFAPAAYWQRMGTIKKTDEGSAKERIDTWKVAFRIFKDPRNTLTGVGMNNTPWKIGDYETANELADRGKSLAGRAVHSMYFQLLADLGLIGAIIIACAVYFSIRDTQRSQRAVERLTSKLFAAHTALHNSEQQEAGSRQKQAPSAETLRGLTLTLGELRNHLGYLRSINNAVRGSLYGAMTAAAFISVLYYPTIWMIIAISAALVAHSKKIYRAELLLGNSFHLWTAEDAAD